MRSLWTILALSTLSAFGTACCGPTRTDLGTGSGTSGSGSGGSGTSGSGSGGSGTSGSGSGGSGTSGTGGNCTLSGQITQSLELTTACHPWHVTSPGIDVEGSANPILTVDPGVAVAFDPGTYLQVGIQGAAGGILVNGSADAGVTFSSSSSAPKAGDWDGVFLGSKLLSNSALSGLSVSYAGSPNTTFGSAEAGGIAVIVDKNQAVVLPMNDVTVAHSGANGLVLRGSGVAFGPGSANLTVTDWATGEHPIVINGNQAGSVPASLSTGASGHDGEVFVVCDDNCKFSLGEAILDHDQTWRSLPIPYMMDHGGIGIGGATTEATLTLAAPNTLEFQNDPNGTGIEVDPSELGLGNLIANGAITFTSASPAPTPGSWGGILFNLTGKGLAGSSLEGVTLDFPNVASGFKSGNQSCPGGASGGGAIFIWDLNSGCVGSVAGPTLGQITFENLPSGISSIVADPQLTTYASYGGSGNSFPSGETVCAESCAPTS